MIAHVRGRVASRGVGHVVVDVGGVGYLLLVPTSLADRIPSRGEEVELHTSLQVREDAMTLYGFPEPAARDLFELLLTASGVGPRLALAALSTLAPTVLRDAIADGDVAVLIEVPGIGKKSAQRIVLELGEKLGGLGLDDAPTGAAPGAALDPVGEVRDALRQLGYTASEALAATRGLAADGEVGELLRQALRTLSLAGVG